MKMNAISAFAAAVTWVLTNCDAQIVQALKARSMPSVEHKKSGRRPTLSTKKHAVKAEMKFTMFRIPLISSCVRAFVTPAPFSTSDTRTAS